MHAILFAGFTVCYRGDIVGGCNGDFNGDVRLPIAQVKKDILWFQQIRQS